MLLEPNKFDPFRGKLATDPSPEEIASRAAEIRATWNAAEELQRRQYVALPWTVPAAFGFGRLPGGSKPRLRPHVNLD